MKKGIESQSPSLWWADIEGYRGLYQVSIDGEVKSLERISPQGHLLKERILKPAKDSKGYLQVILSKKGKQKMHKVHRLVAETWLSNPENLPCINHKDKNPSNNNVENLEWRTHEYNNNWGTGQQRRVERRRQRRGRPIQIIDPDTGNVIGEFPSAKVAEKYGFIGKSISACCRKDKKTYKGLMWRYKEEQPVVAVNKYVRNERISKTLTNRKDQSKPVVAVDKQGRVVHVFPSTKEAGRNGYDWRAVGHCCRRDKGYKTHKGLIWQYKEDFLKKVC